MKYLLEFKIFENILLNLANNTDDELIGKILNLLPNGGKILEIACGNGSDSIKLKELGYDVTATDFTDDYVDYVNQYVTCIKHDTRNEFPFHDNEFDLIYSRLGLHYFTIDELDDIFSEIFRMTKKYLVFSVKLVNDNLQTGKVILDKDKWIEIVSDKFKIKSLEVKKGLLYNNYSEWLEIIAEK
jgi:ubiquinone/menaquinone biosynthesis C-methylase UbiE